MKSKEDMRSDPIQECLTLIPFAKGNYVRDAFETNRKLIIYEYIRQFRGYFILPTALQKVF